MKRIIAIFSLLFVLVGCQGDPPVSTPTAAPTEELAVVYVTDTGTKYHRGDCVHLNQSKIETTLAQAIADGYEPCGTCEPD